jgi:hypothetical protein
MSEDVLERFDPTIHESRNWRGFPLGGDYNIKVLWSMWVPKERAILAENWFKRTYPKKFYCSIDYNGITECRNWTEEESRAFYNLLNTHYPKTKEYWTEVDKLKAEKKLGKTHEKIYYIMLTKKQ